MLSKGLLDLSESTAGVLNVGIEHTREGMLQINAGLEISVFWFSNPIGVYSQFSPGHAVKGATGSVRGSSRCVEDTRV
jgi:hypothetical protein